MVVPSAAVAGGATATIAGIGAAAAPTGVGASVTGFAAYVGAIAPLAIPAAPLYAVVGMAAAGAGIAAYATGKAYELLAYDDDTFPVVEVPDMPEGKKHAYPEVRTFKAVAMAVKVAAGMRRRSTAARSQVSAV